MKITKKQALKLIDKFIFEDWKFEFSNEFQYQFINIGVFGYNWGFTLEPKTKKIIVNNYRKTLIYK